MVTKIVTSRTHPYSIAEPGLFSYTRPVYCLREHSERLHKHN